MGLLDLYNNKISGPPGSNAIRPGIQSLTADEAPNNLTSVGQLNSFRYTSLDLENPNPAGGPINVPYNTPVGAEIVSSPTTQPYTPKKTYKDSLQDPRLIARATDPYK